MNDVGTIHPEAEDAIFRLQKRITELEKEVERWKDNSISERHDLNICEEKVERLRAALEKIAYSPTAKNCDRCIDALEIAEQALK